MGTDYLFDEGAIVQQGYTDLWNSPADTHLILQSFESALRRNPASPFRWEDFGGALLAAGRKEQATYCFQRAVQLAPSVPAVQMRLANFALQTGHSQMALQSMRAVLHQTAAYDAIIFSYYDHLKLDTAALLSDGIPKSPRAAGAFLLNSISRRDKVGAQNIWDWAAFRGLINDNVADAYMKDLVSDITLAPVVDHGSNCSGVARCDHQEMAYLNNGGFEHPLSGNTLDWRLDGDHALQVVRDIRIHHSGRSSLRTQVAAGTRAGVSQYVIVPIGTYSVAAWIRGNGTSSTAVISLQILDQARGLKAAATTSSTFKTKQWTQMVTQSFTLSKSRLLKVSVTVFESGISNAGKVWFDDVTLLRQ